MADEPLILQLPDGGELDRHLARDPPAAVRDGRVVVTRSPTDDRGVLEHPGPGEVVLSVASFEVLRRAEGDVRRDVGRAGKGVEPLVVEVEAADALRDDELEALLEAAARAPRPVIVRVLRDG
jgi:hypothetical protein